ncbi:hypothetical protein NUU61_000690 [Penicillium alfredii]|uniref:Chromatin modification-related protein EAF6 n=1 Tax=Penicillium alfredii TaxID=1506179 RepID=A0A9W9KR88_9EURO|nr:uncharacterized protein NUU61_000690 [Penicillium alfredii]KAJ5114931.1 hypothetical protein NUU61_000690 [Penicillium alfredii]
MAENAPATTPTPATSGTAAPTSGATAAGPIAPADQNAASRGLPYYEKLRRELRDVIQKKRLMDKSMGQLEDQIFRIEQSYLEETTAGNIIRGFDNYIKGSSSGASIGAAGINIGAGVAGGRRKAQVTDSDRVFSRSSASYMMDSPGPSSAQTTPSNAATPTSTSAGPTSNKGNGSDVPVSAGGVKNAAGASKNKKKAGGGGGGSKNTKGKNPSEDLSDDAGDKPPVKRLKISYGRD